MKKMVVTKKMKCHRGNDANKNNGTFIKGTLGLSCDIESAEDKVLEADPNLGVYNSPRHSKDAHSVS